MRFLVVGCAFALSAACVEPTERKSQGGETVSLSGAEFTSCEVRVLDEYAKYNGMIFKGMDADGLDLEGQLAVGEHADLTNTLIGTALETDAQRVDMVVGGDLTMNNSKVVAGRALIEGTAQLTQSDIFGGGSAGALFGFGELRSNYVHASRFLRDINSTEQAKFFGPQAKDILLEGSKKSANIFTLIPEEFNEAGTIRIRGPRAAYYLVRVKGVNIDVTELAIDLQGPTRDRVIFHFPEANSLKINASGIEGTIFAPHADMLFTNSWARGQVIVRSFDGNGKIYEGPSHSTCSINWEDPVDLTAGEIVDEPYGEGGSGDQPYETPSEEPYEAPAEEPYEAPAEEPYEAPAEEPYEAPAEEPYEAPADEPYEAPKDDTYEGDSKESYEPEDDYSKGEEPAYEPTDKPCSNPGQNQYPGQHSDPIGQNTCY